MKIDLSYTSFMSLLNKNFITSSRVQIYEEGQKKWISKSDQLESGN
jgi:hypothetical protein